MFNNNTSATSQNQIRQKLWSRCVSQIEILSKIEKLNSISFHQEIRLWQSRQIGKCRGTALNHRANEKYITKWSNNTKLIHIFNWIMIMNYKMKKREKNQIHFSSTLFRHFTPGTETGERGESMGLIENWNSSKRKWKMESFSICLRWKVFFFHFFLLFTGYA